MRVKTWRRVALAAYLSAGTALAAAGYTVATTAANSANVDALQKRIEGERKKATAQEDNALSAGTVAGDVAAEDSRQLGPVDWAQVVPGVMPSVVNVSAIATPKGLAERSRLWTIPGVQANLATELLTRYRAWRNDSQKTDLERDWRTVGAGFLIDDGRKVLTVAHVLDGEESVRVQVAGGDWRAARVVGVDLASDIGLLEISGEPGRPLPLAKAMPRQGQAVMTIGAPGGYGFGVSAGIVSRYGNDGTFHKSNPFMMIAAPIIGGNSGGVVVNASGEAVGVVSYGIGNFTQTIPIDRALAVAGVVQRSRQ
jgi:serine protease Do